MAQYKKDSYFSSLKEESNSKDFKKKKPKHKKMEPYKRTKV
ncbi:hypothetical protein [Intestinibacter sp.]